MNAGRVALEKEERLKGRKSMNDKREKEECQEDIGETSGEPMSQARLTQALA